MNILKINFKKFYQDLIGNFKSFFEREYFQRGIVVWLLVLSLFFNLAMWVSLKIFVRPVDFPIILHYNVYFGVDSIGNYAEVYLMPAIGIILLVLNFLLSLYFYKHKKRIASYLLLMAALMIQLSLVVASISIILINY